ncbi:TRAP transporter large permease [Sulfurirhabdus autotrophica]|uniref:TRAP transporter large permease protein n=1 Tax=Sulfurirhabdus autotrophica TaxID=1706046 RepID=A0A4V2W103_9PROT|nr:TRAP transporter large permease subunit [Sulfurirhabdus autotrophica]TCV82339.1 tripartite ATP-independent transporter DctM subunit [Sulfurirhabdus autotrophica]
MTATIVIMLLALAALGVPLFIIIGAGGLVAVWSAGLDPAVLMIEMMRLATSPNLMAIPLFTLAGVVLSKGGAPERLIKLFTAGFGWMPGGLAVVVLITCAFFTALSGASGVTILALGGLLYPMLLREGYTKRFSLGLLTSSGSLGLLFPPSMVVLLYGIVAGVNIEQMFKAGFIPGVILLTMLALYSIFAGHKLEIKKHPFSWKVLKRAIRHGVWDLLLPVGIIVGLLGGYVTVTEAATCTAAYAIFLEMVIHRDLNPITQMPGFGKDRSLLEGIFREASVLSGSLMIILSVAMGLTNSMIDAQIPMKVMALLEQDVTSKMQFLMLLNLFLLLVGAVMDIFSATIVIVPLILPLAHRFGVDPIHLGIIFLANLEIGYMTPPVGINLFLASQRFKEPMLSLFRASLPFLFIMLLWLIMVTYVPTLSLWWQ